MTIPAVAAVDWGTSSFRAWLLDGEGAVLAERRSGEGMLTASDRGFAPILETHLAAMDAPSDLSVIVCGMAGARQGWIEAPYVTLPAKLADIVDGAVSPAGVTRTIRILPGLAQRDIDAPDVMRGEETQLAGVFADRAGTKELVCMPGTHSKWVDAEDGAITGFRTWLTGELFSVLSRQSILKHSIGETARTATAESLAFTAALDRALGDGGDIGSSLFRIRAATLLHGLSPDDAAATLSGILIGAEIASARRLFAAADDVILVGSGSLGALYGAALDRAGFAVTLADADEAVRKGLFEAARHLGMIGTAST